MAKTRGLRGMSLEAGPRGAWGSAWATTVWGPGLLPEQGLSALFLSLSVPCLSVSLCPPPSSPPLCPCLHLSCHSASPMPSVSVFSEPVSLSVSVSLLVLVSLCPWLSLAICLPLGPFPVLCLLWVPGPSCLPFCLFSLCLCLSRAQSCTFIQ